MARGNTVLVHQIQKRSQANSAMNNPKYVDLVTARTYVRMLAISVLQVSSWQLIFRLGPRNILKTLLHLALANGVRSLHNFNPHAIHCLSQPRQSLFIDAFIVVFQYRRELGI